MSGLANTMGPSQGKNDDDWSEDEYGNTKYERKSPNKLSESVGYHGTLNDNRGWTIF